MRPNYFDFDRYRARGPYRRLDECAPCELLLELLQAVPAQLREWASRVRARRALARLDHRMLRDIGVTPSEAAREIDKPFWRA